MRQYNKYCDMIDYDNKCEEKYFLKNKGEAERWAER
jgi:hypothetical protein